MKTALKDYSPVWADTFNETFKTDDEGNTVKSLAEQYILPVSYTHLEQW